jgi:nicotinate-nucleotide adenylyltransferase
MKIGIYGGTFDPPHLGHMQAARAAAKALGLERLILVPDKQPPHKALSEHSASPEDRLAMCAIAADRLGDTVPASVSDVELSREGVSYTKDTVRLLRREYPEDELWLLMGTDMFLSFHTWREPEAIARCVNLAAFRRERDDREEAFAGQKRRLEQELGAVCAVVDNEGVVPLSSTGVREALARGAGGECLDESVWGYILMHRLYGTCADLTRLSLQELRACSYSMVKAKRLAHIRGTEETAAKMAQVWGADEESARKAAILHDCTKYFSLSRQLSTCEKYGILLDDMEKSTLALLHSKSGAGIARCVFGMDEEICQAIRWHTTGRADMTLLEKILYIADYAEPSRRYPWAQELRELIYTDLDAAVLRGLEITIAHNARAGQPLHEKTLEAWSWMKDHQRKEG